MSIAYITFIIEQRVARIVKCATSTGASNTLLVVQFASYPLLYGVSYMCNGHSGIVFRVLCPKISTGREKLAPAGWHGWHVFATLPPPLVCLRLAQLLSCLLRPGS